MCPYICPFIQPSNVYWAPTSYQALFSSVQFSCSVMSNSLQPYGLQHTRPPCPSPTPRVYSNLCPLSQWCHPTISSSVVPFSSCPQSLPASESFPMSQVSTGGGQSTGVSALASFLPKNTQGLGHWIWKVIGNIHIGAKIWKPWHLIWKWKSLSCVRFFVSK